MWMDKPKKYETPTSNKDSKVWGDLSDMIEILTEDIPSDDADKMRPSYTDIVKLLERAMNEIEQLEEIEELTAQLLKDSWVFDRSEPCGTTARILDNILAHRW